MAALRKSRWGTAALVAVFALFLVIAAAVSLAPRGESAQKTRMAARPAPVPAGIADAAPSARGLPETDSSEAGPDGAGEERREREEAALVDAFDELVDKWMEPSEGGVSMEDVNRFIRRFGRVPEARS